MPRLGREPATRSEGAAVAERSAAAPGPGADLARLWADAREGRFLAWRLFRRDLSADFAQARLGWLWNFADPLALAAVFLWLRGERVIGGLPLPVPYAVWVVWGMLSLQAFLQALTRPLAVIDQTAAMRSRVRVSPAALVGAQALRQGFDALFYVPVMVAVLLACGLWSAVGALVGLGMYACLVAAGLALGFALAPFDAVYADIGRAVKAANRPLLFVCPTFWFATSQDGWLGWFSAWNPIAETMNAMRLAATGVTPWGEALASMGILAVATSALGLGCVLVFHRTLPVLEAKG